MKAIILLLVSVLFALWVFGFPEAGTSQRKGNAPAATTRDRNFAAEAAMGNMAEVQLGQLAQEKGQSDFLREFGAMMVRDHGAELAELKMLATSKNIPLPSALSSAQQFTYDRIANLGGADFDRAYRAALEKDHEMAIRVFSEYAAKGGDAELRAHAQKALSTSKFHLQILRAGRMTLSPHGVD